MQNDKGIQALVPLRHQFANREFLLEHIYSQDCSRFDGSTYRYIVRVGLPKDRMHVMDALLDQISTPNQRELLRTKLIEPAVRLLPDEVLTVVDVPSSTPPEDSVEECLRKAEIAIVYSLWAYMPYASIFALINRFLRASGFDASLADPLELLALLCSYHRRTVSKAREQSPEVWDTAQSHYVLDSRGVQFATELTKELTARKIFTSDTTFLDVGSGIGTMAFATALASDTQVAGVEIHAQLFQLSRSILAKLSKHAPRLRQQIELILGDVAELDISRYDVLYVYSPLGKCEIELGPIVRRMRTGSIIISERLPTQELDLVQFEPKVFGLFVLRRI